MPFKDKQAKSEHNKAYKANNSELLTIQRIIRLKQKTITQKTYDKIKSFVEDQSFWENVTVRKSLQQRTKEATQNVVTQQPPKPTPPTPKPTTKQITTKTKKYPVVDAIQFIKDKYYDSNLKTYLSRINVLVKLLCKEQDDFMCIYKQESIAIINKAYKTPKAYFDFMLLMYDTNPEVSKRVPKKLYDLLRLADKNADTMQQANTIRKAKERDETTDYSEEYNKLINKDTSQLNDEEKLLRLFYLEGIYDKHDKLQMIPRNYLFDVKIIKSRRYNDKENNFYIINSGTLIINNFKTKGRYQPIVYDINTKIKKMVEGHFKKNPTQTHLFGPYTREKFNGIVTKSVGNTIDNYRRIMRYYNAKKGYSLEDLANAMRGSPTVGEISYRAT